MIVAGEGNCELREKMVVATAGVNEMGWGGGGTGVWLEGGDGGRLGREGGGQRVWEAAVAKTVGEAMALLPLSLFLVGNS